MRFTKALILALLCVPCWAQAATDDEIAQARALAEHKMTRQQEQSCLRDFATKLPGHAAVAPAGAFSFDSAISRDVYDTLYWRGAEHGVAYTVPVRLSGDKVAHLACFYALTGKGIAFQQSQRIAAQ